MRNELTRERLRALMQELARTAPRGKSHCVYLVGGGTAVYAGWRPASIDADLFSDHDEVFRDIQGIKERLQVNVEFARPEHFVPELPGTANRHVLIETIGPVTFYHYDPYAQILSKVVRGFARDVSDARQFIRSGMVDPDRLRTLVEAIPEAAYSRYPSLSRAAVLEAVGDFLRGDTRT
jgi:hypothetical protein